jgi:hypothetical protein
VWEQVVAMASALSDMFLTEADLNLSFDKEKIGEPQPFVLYNEEKVQLVMVSLTTQTRVPGKVFGSKRCISATGTMRCLKASDDEGRAQLRVIAGMDAADTKKKTYEIETLIQKLLLPNLPRAEFILPLVGDDYESKAKRCRKAKPAVEPYNLSAFEHKKLLATFKVHGAHRFAENCVYRVHPNLKLRTYIMVEQYDQVIMEAKRAEFVAIAQQLCAHWIKVKLQEKEEQKKATNAGATAGGGLGEGGGGQEDRQSDEKSQSMDQEFSRPKEMTPQFDPKHTHFYQWEPSWKTMVDGRMRKGANTLSYKCDFDYQSDSAKMAKLSAGMQGIGLDLSGSAEKHLSVNEQYTVKFWADSEVPVS